MSYYIERSNEWYQTPLAHVVNITSRGSVGSVEAMNILQAMLTKVEWYKLVGQVRNVISSGFPSLGISPWPVVTSYSIPFSDCMTLRKRLTATTGLVTPFEVKAGSRQCKKSLVCFALARLHPYSFSGGHYRFCGSYVTVSIIPFQWKGSTSAKAWLQLGQTHY